MIKDLIIKKLEDGPQDKAKIKKIFNPLLPRPHLNKVIKDLIDEGSIRLNKNKLELFTHSICECCKGKGWIENKPKTLPDVTPPKV